MQRMPEVVPGLGEFTLAMSLQWSLGSPNLPAPRCGSIFAS